MEPLKAPSLLKLEAFIHPIALGPIEIYGFAPYNEQESESALGWAFGFKCACLQVWRRKMKKILVAGCLALAAAGCSTQRFTINNGPVSRVQEDTDFFFVGGIAQDSQVNAAQVCGGANRVGYVETSMSALDIVINYFTGAIVSPRTSEIGCI